MPYIGKSPSFGVRNRFVFTPDAGATSVSGADANSSTLTFTDGAFVDVYLNGVLLKPTTDYNTNTANTIAGLTATVANDEVTVIVYDVFAVGDTVSAVNGGTFTGAVTLSGGVTGDLDLNTDSATIKFGADDDVTVTHDPDDGLILKSAATGDDNPFLLTLQTGETDLAANDVIGKIAFQAPDEGTGTDAILVSAAIQAVAEGDHSSSSNATSLQFMTGASEAAATKMTLTSAGNLGINTSSPDAKLEIEGTTDAELRITRSTASTSGTFNDQGAVLNLHNDVGYENGYNGGASIGQIIFSSDDASTGQGVRAKIGCTATTYYHAETLDFYVSPSNTTSNQVSATSNSTSKHVSIFGGGCTMFNYSVSGRTEPHTATRAFEAYSVSDNVSSAVIHNKSTGSYPAGLSIAYDETPDDQDQYAFYFVDGTAARFYVFNDGDVRNHDNSYGATSDERIKQDIVDSNSQWNDIKNIKVRNFKRKDDVAQYGDKAWSQIGVVAQEIETVCPNIIRESNPTSEDIKMSAEFGTLYTQADKDNDDIPEGKQIGDVKEVKSKVKSIGYSVLYMKAVKALQEAMTRIETLEAKVKALEDA